MNVISNSATIDEIKKVLETQPDRPKFVRIFVAGYGWGGPSLGLALDELKDGDLQTEVEGLAFVMEKDLHDNMGDIKVEFVGNGYYVAPVNQAQSDCSSCSSCGE